MSLLKKHASWFFLPFFFGILSIGYAVPRENFSLLLTLFAGVFVLYFLLIRWKIKLEYGVMAAWICRLGLLLMEPNLSDDYFRFFWDGQMVINGFSPFQYLPIDWMKAPMVDIPAINTALFEQLNSPHYYSVYPPVSQVIYAAGAATDNPYGSVLVMRCFILLAEVGNIFLLVRLLQHFRLPQENVLWYALNPLVILELTGNLHFEAVMLFFLLLSIWFIVQQKLTLSAIAFSLAVGVKLLPLLFLPFLFRRLGLYKTLVYCAITGGLLALQFIPFINLQLLANLAESIDLYFHTFEFNASIYYLLRAVGYWIWGYGILHITGLALPIVTIACILFLAVKEKGENWNSWPAMMLWALAIYLLMATTVHPWYICTLAAFCAFTPYRFAIAWTFMSVLSYATYRTPEYKELLWLTALEYTALAGIFWWEFRREKKGAGMDKSIG